MQTGLVYDFSNPPEWRVDPTVLYARQLEQMAWAEQIGIDGVWFSEHHFWDDDYLPSPIPLMAAAAARTSRVTIGSSVLLPSFRHPVQQAEDLALIDIISGGRLELALGLGWAEREFATFGVDPATRVGRFNETIEVIRRAWSEGEMTFKGKHFDIAPIDVRPKPVQRPPRIWAGASAPQGGRRIGRSGLSLAWMEPDVYEAYLEGRRESGLSTNPSDCAVNGYLWMFVCDDPDALWPVINTFYEYNVARYSFGGKVTGKDPRLATVHTRRDAMEQTNFFLVSAEEAIAEMTRRANLVPIEKFVVPANIGGAPVELCNRHVELLATVVAPALAEVGLPAT